MQTHEQSLKAYRTYFGPKHCRAIIDVVGIARLPILIRSCEQRLTDAVRDTLASFVNDLGAMPDGQSQNDGIQGFPIWELPKTRYT